ncbi:MAG: hypothetical protein RIT27_711 [Pseudomonadota bacterium]|jgi:biopolymer transport protein TolQ
MDDTLALILKASLLVQIVMFLLLTMSIYSWTIIFVKRKELNYERSQSIQFLERFNYVKDFNQLYSQLSEYHYKKTALDKIFIMGYETFVKLHRQQTTLPMDTVLGAQRSMKVVMQKELDKIEENLPTLATLGSVSPYIGLFGTVWGIMHSFHGLSTVKQVTLAMVAPGISEALIATAMGLFVAIPAVMAYNDYITKVDFLNKQYENFIEEFTVILQRLIHQMLANEKNEKIVEKTEKTL